MAAENFTSVQEFILVGLTNHRKTQMLLFVVILLTYSFTVLGNLMIIVLVLTDFHLQTPMYFFLTNLSTLEICFVTTTEPQMLAHLMAGNGVLPFTHCVAQMYIATSLASIECFLLAAMAYDRYLAICRPLVYTVAMGGWHSLQLAFASWAIGTILASIPMIFTLRLPLCGPNLINHFCCEVPLLLKLSCADIQVTEQIVVIFSSFILLFPLSLILTSYGMILWSVLQIRSTAGRRKAFSTCASHLAVVSLFYGTAMFMYLIPRSAVNSNYDKWIAVFYAVVTPMLNPIIYTLRNKDVHDAAAKMMGRWGLSYRHQVV
ncbi:putative olfactory receptor 2B3 [Sphaerodactylus townsendi]|uniref:putative olfactory receptor 2B3 n=1 Tax=Sphaerodactylus townsendi TaxID=933632 RepID=UPI002027441D|nr:putative olfactory receptor 2B3 [Sphaerodactylus townsendi]